MEMKIMADTCIFSYAKDPRRTGAYRIMPFLKRFGFVMAQPVLQELLNGCAIRNRSEPAVGQALFDFTHACVSMAGHVEPMDYASQVELASLKAMPSLRAFRCDDAGANGKLDKEVLSKVAFAMTKRHCILTLSPNKYQIIKHSLSEMGKTFDFFVPRQNDEIDFYGIQEFLSSRGSAN